MWLESIGVISRCIHFLMFFVAVRIRKKNAKS